MSKKNPYMNDNPENKNVQGQQPMYQQNGQQYNQVNYQYQPQMPNQTQQNNGQQPYYQNSNMPCNQRQSQYGQHESYPYQNQGQYYNQQPVYNQNQQVPNQSPPVQNQQPNTYYTNQAQNTTGPYSNANYQSSNEQSPYQSQNQQQRSSHVENDMPEIIVSPPLETMKQEIMNEVSDDGSDLNVDGHQVFVRQPVIDYDDNEKNKDLIVNEPSSNTSIFSAPTPVYDPNATEQTNGDTKPLTDKVNNFEVPEQPKANSASSDFLTSMRSFYSALGETEEKQEVKAPNVSDEPLPEFTNNYDIINQGQNNQNSQNNNDTNNPINQNYNNNSTNNITNNANVQNKNVKIDEPHEFNPAQFNQLDGSKKNVQQQQDKNVEEKVEQPRQEQKMGNDQSFLMQMLGSEEQGTPMQQNRQSEPASFTAPQPQQRQQSQQQFVSAVQPQEQQTFNEESQVQEPVEQKFSQQNQINQAPIQQNVQDNDNTNEVNQEKDEQYWKYMNNLLERFDDGEVHTDSFSQSQPQEFNTDDEPNEEEEIALEDFGRGVEKAPVITKAQSVFKKATQEIKEDESEFAKNFSGNFNGDFDSEIVDRFEKPKKKSRKPREKKSLEEPEKPKNIGVNGGFQPPMPVKKSSKFTTKKAIIIIVAFIVALIGIIGVAVFFGKKASNSKANEEYAQQIKTAKSADKSWTVIKAKYPEVEFPTGMQKKYADLYAINNDFVGWLNIDKLDISLPIVQNEEYEYYLDHNLKKKSSGYGTTFMQFDNNVETLDLNTIIYSKSMATDDQMFTNLKEYKTIKGYKKAPVIEFNTLYGNYKWKVFATFITNASPEQDNGYVFNFNFTNLNYTEESEFKKLYSEYIAKVRERSLYNTGVDVKSSDRILTLTTTSDEFKGARIVVVARMIRDGESEEAPLSMVKENKVPRYPQAWYDKNGKTNSYGKDDWNPNSEK